MEKGKAGYYGESESVQRRAAELELAPGEYLFDAQVELLKQQLASLPAPALARRLMLYFKDLPLSSHTQRALAKHGFTKLTEIQRCVVPHALKGRDVLAASKTGSGKTLAYLVPLVEQLYARRWSELDGPGALVVLPTRELALQVFEVLRALLEFHRLSCGLLIGGKSLAAEQAAAPRLNVLVGTPGRLLQHLTETVGLDVSSLQYLVFDEADEIFSLGFAATLAGIAELLPPGAQTLLLSATLSPATLGFAKLALKAPERVFGAAEAAHAPYALPERLAQFYAVVPPEEKLNVVFSFLKAHPRSKVVVFTSTCKQARHMYECLRRLRVGLPTFELQGRQAQPKRLAIFFSFAESKSACLVTTNVSARGLDFPRVDWVLQADCPDSLETYVHRVGRTARLAAQGSALLLLTPGERVFLERLRPLVLKQIFPNPQKQFTVTNSLQALCAEHPELKHTAQRAFVSYARSVDLMRDKAVFNLRRVDLAALAYSFGLAQTPRIGHEDAAPPQPEDVADDTSVPPVASKAQRKLQRLKEKIAAKSSRLRGLELAPERVPQKHIGDQLNELRENPRLARLAPVAAAGEEFLTLKKRAGPAEELPRGDVWKVSKNQLKKVKPGGLFGGRNVFEIDDNGGVRSAAEVREPLTLPGVEAEENEESAPLRSLEHARRLDKEAYAQRLREKRLSAKRRLAEAESALD